MKSNRMISLFVVIVGYVVLMTGSSAHAAQSCYVPENGSGFPQLQNSTAGYPGNYALAPGFIAGSTGGEVVCLPQYTATLCKPVGLPIWGECKNELLYYSECYAFVNFSTSCPATQF